MSIKQSIKKYGYAEISSGTFRAQDLIPAMLEALEELAPETYQQVVSPGCGFSAFPSYAQEDDDHEWWESDDCYALESVLACLLNEHAPEGYHYGSNEGDGASIGFWPCEDE